MNEPEIIKVNASKFVINIETGKVLKERTNTETERWIQSLSYGVPGVGTNLEKIIKKHPNAKRIYVYEETTMGGFFRGHIEE